MMASKKVMPKFWIQQVAVLGLIPLLKKTLKILGSFIAQFKTLSGILLRKMCYQSKETNCSFS